MKTELRVLLIEDSGEEAALVKQEINHHRKDVFYHRVDTISNLEKALKDQWDIVLSGFDLPELDGFLALYMVKTKLPETPFILVSGYVKEDTATQLMHLGAADYIMKDNLKRLYPAIERELAEYEVRKKLLDAEEEIKALSQIAKFTSNGVIILNVSYNIEWINAGFTDMVGYSFKEIKGKKIQKILNGPDTAKGTQTYMQQLIDAGEPFNCEMLNYTKTRQKKWLNWVGKPIINDSGIIEKYFIVQIDLTEKKLYEEKILKINEELEEKVRQRTEELELLNEDLSRFNFLLSHELKGSLRFVNLFFDTIKKRTKDKISEKDFDMINLMHSTSIKMSDLITAMLKYSQLGKKEIEREDVDLNLIVDEIVFSQKKLFENKTVEVIVGELPEIFSDRMIMNVVFENLISNAFKYSKNNDSIKVEIGYEEKSNEHLIYVKDSGVGFDMVYKDKLFKFFSRLHTESQFEGLGVGLAGVKTMIEKLDGDIWVDAKLNEGAKFSFTIPKTKIENNTKN